MADELTNTLLGMLKVEPKNCTHCCGLGFPFKDLIFVDTCYRNEQIQQKVEALFEEER